MRTRHLVIVPPAPARPYPPVNPPPLPESSHLYEPDWITGLTWSLCWIAIGFFVGAFVFGRLR